MIKKCLPLLQTLVHLSGFLIERVFVGPSCCHSFAKSGYKRVQNRPARLAEEPY